MRWLFGSTIVVLALSLAWSVPQRGQAQGSPMGPPAPKQSQPSGAPSGYGYGYPSGMPGYPYPGYPYPPNPYGMYPGMYRPPYGGYMGMGYGGYMGMGYGGYMGMGYGGYSPYGMYQQPPPPPTSQAEVTIYDNYFEPRTVSVTPGGSVRWTNKGKHVHTVRGLAGHWGSKDLQPGKSYTFTLPTGLNHHYYCSHHPLEMNGIIVVRPPQPTPPQGQGQGGYTKSGY